MRRYIQWSISHLQGEQGNIYKLLNKLVTCDEIFSCPGAIDRGSGFDATTPTKPEIWSSASNYVSMLSFGALLVPFPLQRVGPQGVTPRGVGLMIVVVAAA